MVGEGGGEGGGGGGWDVEERVTGLRWNDDGTLAVVILCVRRPKGGVRLHPLKPLTNNDDKTKEEEEDENGARYCGKVQLWHLSNYRWYLKGEFRHDNYEISHAEFDGPYDVGGGNGSNGGGDGGRG